MYSIMHLLHSYYLDATHTIPPVPVDGLHADQENNATVTHTGTFFAHNMPGSFRSSATCPPRVRLGAPASIPSGASPHMNISRLQQIDLTTSSMPMRQLECLPETRILMSGGEAKALDRDQCTLLHVMTATFAAALKHARKRSHPAFIPNRRK
jgi:hypothetical protein